MKGCDRETRSGRALWCELHYRRAQRGADMNAPPKRGPGEPPPPCCLPWCERPGRALGLCTLHYQRQHYGKRLADDVRVMRPGTPCSVEGCEEPYIARGMCSFHYHRAVRGVPLGLPKGARRRKAA